MYFNYKVVTIIIENLFLDWVFSVKRAKKKLKMLIVCQYPVLFLRMEEPFSIKKPGLIV